ncbi:MAG: SulP family inorganic anion transporter [Planctomycetes bacterium]|nr:SulP family inorganic anion transporter [Planctomycetota bacterium]
MRLPTMAGSVREDAPAALVVFLVALPLCLGIALASGAPLFSGVISGIVGGIVIGILSGSQLMVSGPAAGLTAIVVSAIGTLGSYPAFLMAVVLSGGVQIVLGALRAGVISYYFPSSVIRGMLAAIGLILILKQLPHAVGWDHDFEGDESFVQPDGDTTFTAIDHALHAIEPGALLIAAVSLALLTVWDKTVLKRLKLLPGPLVAVLAGVGINAALQQSGSNWTLLAEHLVQLPVASSAGEFFSFLSLPDFSASLRADTWRVAVTLGVVASLETLLSLEATDRMDTHKRVSPPNRELFAQGVGNALSGLIGGLPMTGVIVRSAANIDAGGKTKLAAILHGVLLLVAVVTIPALLNSIPLASLAAVLLYTGFKLAHPRIFRAMWGQGWKQSLPFAATIVAILLTDLLVGITLGLAMAFAFILLDEVRFECFTVTSPPGAVLKRVQLQEQVSFLNKASLAKLLASLEPGDRLEINGSSCRVIHRDVLEQMADFQRQALERGIDLRLVGIDLPTPPLGH